MIGSSPQIFSINGSLTTDGNNAYVDKFGVRYGANTQYLIAPGNQTFKVFVKDVNANDPHTTGDLSVEIGKNYSVFYTKTNVNDSSLFVIKEDLTIDTAKTKLLFVNLGYTLKSRVVVRDSLKTFTKTLGYGEKSDYLFLNFAVKNKLYLNLVDSVGVVDSISASNFSKGKIFTILIDGTNIGKLKERLISNN
ncbi:DUF4397 domain-containing protein [Pedobacter changchengzhani]|uniref:DUF4397 domain-containing protein n=1 Tax=Pedobacter changchengzhani TaxID=2529274 RepID=A0A4R5MM85_9SPHI|nr:DUF4397 domain-containing protein [Pedobacter changchengzhani]TDG36840.1 DUF4397 domain-containing protein [Pedobacter changchengzhani]